jgi:2-succinyl-5-enolpyruvyl-6-hydroxy-3-cyclohexene-1-carboxylate synthase
LRLGGVPTARLWRDLERQDCQIPVCSISENPYSGLSYGKVIQTSFYSFFNYAMSVSSFYHDAHFNWTKADRAAQQALLSLFHEEPFSEPGLIHALSAKIPERSKVYLGNSLPIREWDQAATYLPKWFQMASSRGANGIDGQMATFLGYSSSEQDNWSILGDLTVLYDLVAPWITPQLKDIATNVVVINNGGAGIFARMFAHPAFQNSHCLSFEPIAKFWGWRYERWESIPSTISPSQGGRLIELIPDAQSTERFLNLQKNTKKSTIRTKQMTARQVF